MSILKKVFFGEKTLFYIIFWVFKKFVGRRAAWLPYWGKFDRQEFATATIISHSSLLSHKNILDLKIFFSFLGLNWKGFRLSQSVNSGQVSFSCPQKFFFIFFSAKKNFCLLLTAWRRQNIIHQAPIRI